MTQINPLQPGAAVTIDRREYKVVLDLGTHVAVAPVSRDTAGEVRSVPRYKIESR